MQIRLAIVDDHELVRAGLVMYLGASPDIEVVLEAGNGVELLEKLRSTQADLLLLDMSMPGENGVNLIRHIKRDYPDLLILVLSRHDGMSAVRNALKAGAAGYICKTCSPVTLLDAILKTVATGKYLSPSMVEQLAYTSISSNPDNNELTLSDREQEVFRLIVAGKSISEIAKELSISDKTVSTHKINILAKLGLKNVAGLVTYAMQRELFH